MGGPTRGPFLQKSRLRMGKITNVNAKLDVTPCQHLPYCPGGKLPPEVPTSLAVDLCLVQIYLFDLRMLLALWKVDFWTFSLHLSWRCLGFCCFVFFFFQQTMGNTAMVKNGNSFEGLCVWPCVWRQKQCLMSSNTCSETCFNSLHLIP